MAEELEPTDEDKAELAAVKTREALEQIIQRGILVHETLKTRGFLEVIKPAIDEKINDGKLKWLAPNLTDKQAETMRQKTAVWRDVYSLFQTAIRKAGYAKLLLQKLDSGEAI
jgi:hypothetical protein